MADFTSLSNQLLIAMPSLADPNFVGSVTYICDHTPEGAMGIIVNRPTEMTLEDVFQQLGVTASDQRVLPHPVYFGGPVLPERGFILHRPEGNWESSLQVAPGIALTTSRDVLNAMAHGYGPRDAIFALGYAGWGSGQLEAEMSDNAWLTVPAEAHVLFEMPPEARWRAAAELIGIDPRLLTGQSGHA